MEYLYEYLTAVLPGTIIKRRNLHILLAISSLRSDTLNPFSTTNLLNKNLVE